MSTRFAVVGSLVLGGLIFLASLALLQVASSGGTSSGGTLASGRAVTARSDSWYLACDFAADTATVKTAGRTIMVAPNRLMVDGRTLAAIDAATKSVDVSVQRGEITFVADGQTVAKCAR